MSLDRQGSLLKKTLMLTGIATAMLAPMQAGAQITYSPREMALLPEYCKYTQEYRHRVAGGNDLEKIQQWYAVFGGSLSSGGGGTGIFHAMHHYCWGLTKVNYAKFWAQSPQERQGHFQASIHEFEYVIQNSQPDEKMLPEFLTKKGESLIAVGKAPLAVVELERAIALKPDYWPPYAAMSDYYKKIGNINRARELLERGLASSPDARALTRRLAELDAAKGKPSATSQPSRKPTIPKQPAPEHVPQPDPDPQAEAPQSPAGK